MSESTSEESFDLTVLHHGVSHTFSFGPDSTVKDLAHKIHGNFFVPLSDQKYMISPKVGILKPPFEDSSIHLATLRTKKIQLLAATPSEIASLSKQSARYRSSPRSPTIKATTLARNRDWRKVQEEATYTFHTLVPLSYLPNPERSLRYLERLRNDPGIKASMRKHKFSVGVLTEMNPVEHTTRDSKTLGLNRNRGEAIELRLRTDAYDGYRDYKIIRKTLCHELSHNIWGEHDRNFWDLTKDIEKEVERNDWLSGGHSLTNEEFYNPNDQGEQYVDGGGWSGGEFVLGGTESQSATTGLTRREVMAKAAEERMKRQREIDRERNGEGTG